MNKVTVRNTNMPPNFNKFAENFAGIEVLSLVDYFFKYDNFLLDKTARNMTAIATLLSFLRQITLLQKATNSITQY